MADKSTSLPRALRLSMESGETSETSLECKKSIVIGRGAECDLVLRDVKASRRHCRLTRTETEFILEDLGSKNGTLVDGRRITEAVSLKSHQTFQIGSTMFYLT